MKNLKKHNHDSKHINSDYLGRCVSTGKIIYPNLDPEDWKIEMLMFMRFAMLSRLQILRRSMEEKTQEAAYRCESAGNYRLADQIRHEIENYSS